MAAEWEELSLRDAGISLIDCDHRTPPASETGYPYVTIPQLRHGRIELANARRITREHYIDWTRKAKPRPNDVVLSRRCNPGETAFVSPGMEFALGQNLVLLRADGTRVYPPFLRWLVRGPEWWRQVEKYINVGAVFDSLKCKDIPNFRLRIPPVPIQRSIADVLGTLDDKIELNRKMSATLEAIARAIFKSWFVDFDPVRAKAEGRRPEGMDEATAALFPERFGGDGLPEGWRRGRLGDIATCVANTVSPSDVDPGMAYFGLEHMPRRSISLPSWGRASDVSSLKLAFNEQDVLFGKLRPYFHKVGIAPVSGVCSTDIIVLRPTNPRWLAYCVAIASSDDFVNYTDRTSSGTKMPRTNQRDVLNYEIDIPAIDLVEQFQHLVKPFLVRIIANVHECRTLAEVRDLLLPRLVSGQLRISDFQHMIERSVA